MQVRTFDSYVDMQVAHQKDVDNFPMVWMFGPKTEEEILECIAKIGAKSLTDCMGNGAGGLILKRDKQKYLDMFEQHRLEREAFAAEDDRLYEMILREMYNHEYGYTNEPHDTLTALGKTYEDLEQDERFMKAWKKAQKKCFEE